MVDVAARHEHSFSTLSNKVNADGACRRLLVLAVFVLDFDNSELFNCLRTCFSFLRTRCYRKSALPSKLRLEVVHKHNWRHIAIAALHDAELRTIE